MTIWNPLAGTHIRRTVTLQVEQESPQEVVVQVAGHRVTPSLSGYDFVATRLRFAQVHSAGFCVPNRSCPQAFSAAPGDGGLTRYLIAAREGDFEVVAGTCTNQELDSHEFLLARRSYAALVSIDECCLFLPVSSASALSSSGRSL